MVRTAEPTWIAATMIAALLFPVLAARAEDSTASGGPVVLTDEGRRVHASGVLVDGHNDLLWQIRKLGGSFDVVDIAAPQPRLQTDLPRLRAGGVGAQFWSIWVPPETADTHEAREQALQQFDLFDQMLARYAADFALATTAADVERLHREGKIACLLGVEGGHMIEGSLDHLREFYARGARYLTLTHSATIDWADSATDAPKSFGLSDFGRQVVREMNRLGMLVDISHVSHDTMRDALRVSRAPVIASHSSAYAVAAHVRNVPDDVLREIARNRGVVMVNFYSGYSHPQGAKASAGFFEMEREIKAKYADPNAAEAAMKAWTDAHPVPRGDARMLVDHIDHIVRVAGIDCVGIGSDFDGIDVTPVQLDDVSGFPYLTQALLDRGYAPDDIHKIMGGNVLRALSDAERIARE